MVDIRSDYRVNGCEGAMPTISYASVGLYRSSDIVGCGGPISTISYACVGLYRSSDIVGCGGMHLP